jgi:hypothetical protein
MRGTTNASRERAVWAKRVVAVPGRRSRRVMYGRGEKGVRSRLALRGGPEQKPTAAAGAGETGVTCWFGARSVGVLLDRMRLHLGTQRFLAARRGDREWEAGCDYGALALGRLESRLRPRALGTPLLAEVGGSLSGRRIPRGPRPTLGDGAPRATAWASGRRAGGGR